MERLLMNQLQTDLMRETVARKMREAGFEIDISDVTFDVPECEHNHTEHNFDIIVFLDEAGDYGQPSII